MKAKKPILKPTLRHIFFLLFLGGILSISCSEWLVPLSLTGKWSAMQEITFREKINGKYKFTNYVEKIELVVNPDGSVTGNIGNGVFKSSKVVKNRGSFGKFINIKTDYRIIGTLEGKINSFDSKDSREISVPFNVLNNETQGTIFESSGINIFPFADMKLKKTKS